MRATIRDTIQSLTIRNISVLVAVAAVITMAINLLDFLIWRRFPVPTLIVAVGVLGWKIGRLIGHEGISRTTNAGAVTVIAFGVAHWAGAMFDSIFFPVVGYFSWAVYVMLWAWIFFHIWRAYFVLKTMPPERRQNVHDSLADVYVDMTYRQTRGRQALEEYKKVKQQLNFAPVTS